MIKNITSQDICNQRKKLQQDIITLLKERNLTELKLEFPEESQSPTYIVDYCERNDSWYEKQVIAVGICEDGDWYLKVYDNMEDEESTIYDSEQSLATNNIDWLLGIRSNIREILGIADEEKSLHLEYAQLKEQLHQAELDILHFMLSLLKEKQRISLNLTDEEREDRNNYPITTTVYEEYDTLRIRLTDVYLSEDGKHILVDGIEVHSDDMRKGFYVYPEQYADVFHFVGHCI